MVRRQAKTKGRATRHSHDDNSGFSGYGGDLQRAHDQTLLGNDHPLYQGSYLGIANGSVLKYDPYTKQQSTFQPGEPED